MLAVAAGKDGAPASAGDAWLGSSLKEHDMDNFFPPTCC